MHWFNPRRTPDIESHSPINAVYARSTCSGYYFEAVLPDALRLKARPGDRSDEIVKRLPRTIRRFLFHLDLSVTAAFPADRGTLLELLEARNIRTVNGRVTDLRKQVVQSLCRELELPCAEASVDGDPDEMLIVKSDLNYGGRSERLLTRSQRSALGVRTSASASAIRNALDYKVMRRHQVPAAWWTDRELFIERFIDNREHRLHRVRISLDRFVFSGGCSPRQVKKLGHCTDFTEHLLIRNQRTAELPAALLDTAYRFAAAFHLEFGALDIVADDGGCYFVIDANTTPGMGHAIADRLAFLREPWTAQP